MLFNQHLLAQGTLFYSNIYELFMEQPTLGNAVF